MIAKALEASPDSIVVCKCCEKGDVEVKCLLCAKDRLPHDEDKIAADNFCAIKKDGGWTLKSNHSKLQMSVCKVKYCDFVLWIEKTTTTTLQWNKLLKHF